MIESFGIKDILDITIVALMLYYLYKIMKESGTINIFYGVLAFILLFYVLTCFPLSPVILCPYLPISINNVFCACQFF